VVVMMAGEPRLKVLALAGVVSAIIIFGSIGVVRFSNRDRRLTPAVVQASRALGAIPDSLIPAHFPADVFARKRDEFASHLERGILPVDSVRAFYQSYALWMRDGRWDTSDVRRLTAYLGVVPAP
jgi:hypothetical protein